MRTPRVPALCMLLFVVSSLGAAALQAQAASQADARERLSFFVGRWTVEGSERTYLETCEWLSPASFVVCRAEDTNPQERSVSLSIFGYSPEEQAYTYEGFDGSGSSRTLRAWLQDGRWTFTGGRESGGRSTRWQITITPDPRGFHFRQDVSVNGAPWTTNFETQYIRLP